MYKLFKLSEYKKWHELESYDSLKDAVLYLNRQMNDENVFIFWHGKLPKGTTEQTDLFQKVIKENKNKVHRVTIGTKINGIEKIDSISNCPGNCYCVVDEDSRKCETYYCDSNGLCWWVSCNLKC